MPNFLRNLLLGLFLVVSIPAVAQPPVINVNPTATSGCSPLTVSFTNNGAQPGQTHGWVFSNPGGGTSANASPGWTFIAPGTYTVTYTVSNSSGSATKSWTITVHPSPVVDFTANPTSGCADLPVQLTDASNPGGNASAATYSWIAGPYIGTAKNPNVTFAPCGNYNVSLKVKNSFGCEATVIKSNYINVFCKPVISFAATPTVHCLTSGGPTSFTSNFTSVVSLGTTPYTYLWDFGNSPPFGTTPNPSNVYNTTTPTSYNVKLTVTDANGCKAELTKPNYIDVQKITPSFTSPATACVFTVVNVTNTSTPGITYTSWNWGDGPGNTLGTPAQHIYTAPGTYKIKMTTQNGACQDTISKTITILPQPPINFSFIPPKPCPAPQTLNFIATGGSSYTWDFGTPPTGSGANVAHTYTNNGWYTVTVFGQDNNGCKDTVTYVDTVKIYDGTLEIEADTPGGCIPKTVCFKGTIFTTIPLGKYIYPHAKLTHTWDFGDGSPLSYAVNPCHTYTTYGTHVVKLTVTTVNGCTFFDTAHIKTGPMPTAGFTATPVHQCVDQPTFFTNTSINSFEWFWDFGDSKSSLMKDPTHIYEFPGVYTVILHASNNFCKDTFMRVNYITIDPPKSLVNYKVSCDTPRKVNFTNKSLRYTWHKWYFADPANTTSLALHPSFTYPTIGNYQPYLVTFNDTFGCYDTFYMSIVLESPTVTITATDTSICPTQSIMFTGGFLNGSPMEYYWYVNDVYQTYASPYTHTFNNPGLYKITLKVEDVNGCLHTLHKPNWVIASRPNVNFTANPSSGCMPMTVNFTDISTPLAPSSLVTRFWDFGPFGTYSSTGTTASMLYNSVGAFTVKLFVTDDNGCIDSMVKPAFVSAYKPVADFNADDLAACLDQEVNFVSASTNASFGAWTFGDGGTGTGLNPKHAYTQTGTYDVRLIVTDSHGCKDTIVKPAYIGITEPDADFSISDSFSICAPHQVFFTNKSMPGSGLTYDWDMGNGFAVTKDPATNYAAAGYYNVRLVVTDAGGCTDTSIQHVNVLGYAGSLQYTPLSGCVPLEVNFSVNVTNVPSIIWDFNDGNTLAANNTSPVSHTYITPGAYIPKIIFSDGGSCTSGSYGKDTIKVDGVFSGFEHTPACEGYMVQFIDTSKGVFSPVTNWAWTFDDGKTSVAQKPFHYYPTVGRYGVSLIVTNGNGCKDTIDTEITINPLPTISAGGDTIICLKDYASITGTGGVKYAWTPAGTLSCADCAQPQASPDAKTEYTVIGTDANGCSDTDKVKVDIKIKTTSDVGDGGEICDDEGMIISAFDATRYEWFPAADVDNANSPTPLARPHRTTNFMVVAYEGSCIPDTNYVKVIVHPKPTVRASGEATIIAGKSTPIDASGDLIKRFQWAPTESLTCADCPSPMASPTKTTTYNITAFTDFGCADSAKVTIHVVCDNSQLFIPNTFTPNGDGQNDIFYPRGVGLDQLTAFRVYNRWGEVVYSRTNVKLNDKTNGWDGTFNGKQLSPDVFVYTVEAQCKNGEILKLKGDITLVR